MLRRLGTLMVLLSLPLATCAEPQVVVRGLFKGGAVLVIDGSRQMMRSGQTSAEGVRLISADTRVAVIELDGQRHSLGLSKQIASRFVVPEKKTTVVHRDGNNQYLLTGAINGVNAEMLVDTGANAEDR